MGGQGGAGAGGWEEVGRGRERVAKVEGGKVGEGERARVVPGEV